MEYLKFHKNRFHNHFKIFQIVWYLTQCQPLPWSECMFIQKNVWCVQLFVECPSKLHLPYLQECSCFCTPPKLSSLVFQDTYNWIISGKQDPDYSCPGPVLWVFEYSRTCLISQRQQTLLRSIRSLKYSKTLVWDGYNWSSSGENRKEDYEAQYFEYERDSRARIILLVQRKTEKETTPPQAQVASWPNSGIGPGSTCLVPPKQKGHFTFSFCADHYCLMN